MKSFNQHINKDREKIKEDLNEKKDEKLVEDLTDLVWAAAAGAGLYGLGKVWDKWGKDMAASLPFATDKMKADAIERQETKRKEKVDRAQKIADNPKSSEKDRKKAEQDLEDNMTDIEYRERSTDKKEKGEKERIAKGDLTPAEIAQKKIDRASKASGEKETLAKADELDVTDIGTAQAFFKKHGRAPAGYQEYPDDSEKVLDTKSVEKLKKDAADKKEKEREAEAERKAIERATAAAAAHGKDKEKEGNQLKPKGTRMTITERNELQAIMALDDAGIKAEINRKGEVVVKKKDLKKAQKELKKSFKKGGEPKLVGEELQRTAYEVVSEARTKVIKNKPKWEPEDSEPRLS